MNWKSTVFLFVLGIAGVVAWGVSERLRPTAKSSPTLDYLKKSLAKGDIQRIEVRRGADTRFVLEKTGQEWSLPGKWPVRTAEAQAVVGTLSGLSSRFASTPIDASTDVKENFGLGDSALTVKLQVDGQEATLHLGEKPGNARDFDRPTYLRLGDNKEVIRLGPGVIAALDRPVEYFQQRRLFPTESVAKEGEGQEKVEQLAASAVRVERSDEEFALVKNGDVWEIKAPARDRVEPRRLKDLLVACADLWAEKFIDKKGKTLDDFGLKSPEYTLTVTRPSGAVMTMQIGRVSRSDTRTVMKQIQLGPNMPPKMFPEKVTVEYRYAKLQDNDQVFEIKADKLRDIAVKSGDLRDPKLARFSSDDVQRLEIEHAGKTLVFVRVDGKWRFEQPSAMEAETGPIRDLLEKLSDLEVKEKDILDRADLKSLGLEVPVAVVKVTVEESAGGKEKDKKKAPREVVYRLGVKDKEKDKLYVQVAGWPRVNALDDSLLKLVERPALAYRNRKVLDVALADVSKIEIDRAGEKFMLEKTKDGWRHGDAKVEYKKVEELARALAKLEAVDFVAENAKEEDLEKLYGLGKATLSARLSFTDEKKPSHTLLIGKKREGKQEYFARLDAGPVIAVRGGLHDDLDRDALAYRIQELWKHAASDVAAVTIHKDGQKLHLKKDGLAYKITEPFEATATPFDAEDLFQDVSQMKVVKFVTASPKDLAEYGLDKPALKLVVQVEKPTAQSHTILVGKEADGKSRYAKLEGSDAVFTLGAKEVSAFDRTPFDLLDKTVLIVEPAALVRVRGGGATPFTLSRKDNAWQVSDSPAPTFTAEVDTAQDFVGALTHLRGASVVAYGPKIDWATFGLDKPAFTVTVTSARAGDKEKTVEHVLAIGKEKEKGQRYARLDKEDRVVLLDAATSKALAKGHLDFVDPRVLKFDLDSVTGLIRKVDGADVELARRDDNWRITKPADRAADDPTLGDVLEKTFRLKAVRIAEYPAKELDKFGLAKPAAVLTLQTSNGDHVIKIGNPVQDADKKDTGERYALVDKGDAVVVLSAELSRHLVAPVLYFADRNLASFAGANKAILERGSRKLMFTKGDGAWEMVEPVKAEAEDAELEKLLKGLRRLRADEIVAEKGADLKAFGLDRPEARWRLLSGDRDVLDLHVGKEKDGKRFAKLAGSDAVFLLSTDLSKRTLDEYRGKKPWPALDAVQVEKLSVAGPATFNLKKGQGGGWTLSSDLVASIDSKKVNDTLDALADLRAERYLVDTKPDLKLYGLEPPVWTIEVQLANGKRTLLLGRAEGDSKRLYATVIGSDAVFVIDEATTTRLLRPESGYLEGPKK